jgi:biopolymer transport protein TolR
MQEFEPEEDAITGINVTPLVDITLVLLIIFMVTARFLDTSSFNINLPKSSTGAKARVVEDQIFLTLTDRGEIFLNKSKVSRDELQSRIRELLKENPGLSLVVRADKDIPHGDVVAVLDQIRSGGVSQFGIAVDTTK